MFECKICKKTLGSLTALNIHLTKSHSDINKEKYYLDHLNGKVGKCPVCSSTTKFISLLKGYSLTCVNRSCSAKLANIKGKDKHKESIPRPREQKQKCPKDQNDVIIHKDCLSSEDVFWLKEKTKICNPRGIDRSIKYSKPSIHMYLKNLVNRLGLANITEAIYLSINTIESPPTCPGCDQKISFTTLDCGYNDLCGNCLKVKNTKDALMKKYGVDSPSKIPDFKEKFEKTCMEKYGVRHHFQNQEYLDKQIKTFQDKYGVDRPLQSNEIKQKVKKTCLARYGVEHHSKSEDIQMKKRQTCIERYGVDHVMKIPKVVDKVKQSWEHVRLDKTLQWKEQLKDADVDIVQYNGAAGQVSLLCKKCLSEFSILMGNLKFGGGVCPQCYPMSHGTSKQEKEVNEFIRLCLPNIEIIENDRSIIYPYEIDIVIPSKRIAIEYCGMYFHSSGPKSHNDKPTQYHRVKYEMCKKAGFRLITIFENDWVFKPNVVKTKIIEALDIKCKQQINSIECEIKLIPTVVKKIFLDKYHLYGDYRTSENYGMFHNDVLISVMCFIKRDYKLWQLIRFCNKPGMIINSAAISFITRFRELHIGDTIFTYVDNKWPIEDFYKHVGFKFEKSIGAEHWYWKNGNSQMLKGSTISKSKLREFDSYSDQLSEFEIMNQEGYSWIYDCGSDKFVLTS